MRATRDELAVTRTQAEDFLYTEAALLDAWRLPEWQELFTADARYVVPATDQPNADPRRTLSILNDDIERIAGRVRRLMSNYAHIENPPSRTRRLITNVRLLEPDDGDVTVASNFCIYRARRDGTDVYVGQHRHRLRLTDGVLRIAYRQSTLDYESLRECGGVVSIIV